MPNPLDDVTQDLRDDDGNPLRRVYVNGAGQPTDTGDVFQPAITNRLTQAVAPAQQQYDLPTLIAQVKAYLTDPTGFSGGTKVGNRLFGTGGEERYQTWPERMIRSGTTLAGDEMAGGAGLANMGLRREDVTDIPKPGGLTVAAQPGDETRERAMDMAGIAGGGALTERPGAGTLGSGPVRPGAKAVPVEPAPVFYSALEHATTNAAQDVMSPQQWLGYLKNQPGVKAEELAWTGLPEWLNGQKGKVNKEDVKTYLDEHKVEIKDVTKTGRTEPTPDEIQGMRDSLEEAHGEGHTEGWTNQEIMDEIKAFADEPDAPLGGVKYEAYQLPGGENYREHLLTMPHKAERAGRFEISNASSDGSWFHVFDKDGVVPNVEFKTRAQAEKFVAQQDKGKEKAPDPYRSSHWDEPNVLAHVRTNDRVIGETPISEIEAKIAAAVPGTKLENMASGMPSKLVREGVITPQEAADWSRARGFRNNGFDDKPGTGQKSLHIEEIQSDWHQQGRKQGYRPPNPEVTPELKDISARVDPRAARNTDPAYWAGAPNWVADAVKAGRITQAEADQLKAYNDAWTMKGVPDAPFKTTWPELALKRMIRHAAENGYDRISWTPGEAQAARYDLSKQVRQVSYNPETKELTATPHGDAANSAPLIKQKMEPEKIADFIGKDAAKKLLETDKNRGGYHVLDGEGLKVGGEGMREFYDKMLPKMAEKIGKAHGVKVKQINLPADRRVFEDKTNKEFPWHAEDDKGTGRAFKTEKEAREWAKQGPPVHYFDLPQSLKDHAIGKGFPLYMSGIPFPLTPVDHDPFSEGKSNVAPAWPGPEQDKMRAMNLLRRKTKGEAIEPESSKWLDQYMEWVDRSLPPIKKEK